MGPNAGRGVVVLAFVGAAVWILLNHTPVPLPVAIVGLGATFLLIVPLGIHANVRVPLHVEVTPVDPRQTGPAWLASFLETTSKSLAAEGFAFLGAYASRSRSITFVRAVLRAPETGDVAVIFGAYLEVAPTLPKARYLAFTTELAGSRERSTTNRKDSSDIPPPAGWVVERFPQIDDPLRLYRIHRALLEREQKREPVSYRESSTFDPVQFLLSLEEHARKNQLALKYFVEEGQVVRPTWKGALLMGLPRAPIVRPVLEARARARATAKMRELGV